MGRFADWRIGLVGLFLCLATAATDIADAAADHVDLSSLGSTYWRLRTLSGTGIQPDAVVTIDINGIEYSNPCSSIYYGFQQKNGRLAVTPPSGMQSCEGWSVEQFSRDLSASVGATLDGRILTLTDTAGKPRAILVRFDPSGIEYRRWFITVYIDGSNLVTPLQTKTGLPITFTNGRIERAGPLGGQYQLSAGRIDIQARWGIAGLASAQSLKEIASVCDALNRVRSAEGDASGMVLRDDNGVTQIELRP